MPGPRSPIPWSSWRQLAVRLIPCLRKFPARWRRAVNGLAASLPPARRPLARLTAMRRWRLSRLRWPTSMSTLTPRSAVATLAARKPLRVVDNVATKLRDRQGLRPGVFKGVQFYCTEPISKAAGVALKANFRSAKYGVCRSRTQNPCLSSHRGISAKTTMSGTARRCSWLASLPVPACWFIRPAAPLWWHAARSRSATRWRKRPARPTPRWSSLRRIRPAGSAGSLFGIISTDLIATSRASFLSDYRPTQVSQPWRSDVINKAQSLIMWSPGDCADHAGGCVDPGMA